VTSSTNPAVPLPNFHDGIGAEELRREAARALHARFKQHVTETPATYNLGDVQLGSYRHKCRGRKDRPAANAPTKAIDLNEVYWEAENGSVALAFKEGKCKACGDVARNDKPLFFDPSVRPPLEGRVSRA
jgi:hypothetical protein